MGGSRSYTGASILVVAFAAGSAVAENLRPAFGKGEESFYVRRVDTREVRTIGETDVEVHNTGEVGLKFKVDNVESDGAATLECTALYVERTEVIGDQSTTFDSRKGGIGGEKAPWTRKIRDYLNKPFKLTIDKHGAVTKVEGLPSTGRTQFNPFEDLLSESAFQRLPIFATAGSEPNVKGGSVWTQRFDHPVAMSNSRIVEELQYKVETMGKTADISFTGKYTTIARDLGSDESGKVSTVKDLQGSREGKLTWDVDQGRCVEARSAGKLQWSEVMPGAENMPIKVQRTTTDALKQAKVEDFNLRTPPAKAKPDAGKQEPKETGGKAKDETSGKAKGHDEDGEESDNGEDEATPRDPE